MDLYRKIIDEALQSISDRYDMGENILDDFKQILLAAARPYATQLNNTTKVKTVVSTGGKSTRKRTGYNCYIKECFEKLKTCSKTDGDNSQAKMEEFSKSWASVSKEEKDRYQAMADTWNRDQGIHVHKKASSGKRGVSGYNLFYRENVARIKQEIREHGSSSTLMQTVGAEWRALGSDGQEVWNEKARNEEHNRDSEE